MAEQSTTDQALAVIKDGESEITRALEAQKLSWPQRVALGGALVGTGFMPSRIDSGAKAAAIMLKGEELGIPRMYALSNIHIVEGKPTCSAELMLALVKRDHRGRGVIRVKESTNERCVVEWRDVGWEGTSVYAFTIEDATKAGLATKDVWKKYPAAMLRARAISAACRMAFPESIAGMYTPEELGASVTVRDDGAVEAIEATHRPTTPTVTIPEPAPDARADDVIEGVYREETAATQRHAERAAEYEAEQAEAAAHDAARAQPAAPEAPLPDPSVVAFEKRLLSAKGIKDPATRKEALAKMLVAATAVGNDAALALLVQHADHDDTALKIADEARAHDLLTDAVREAMAARGLPIFDDEPGEYEPSPGPADLANDNGFGDAMAMGGGPRTTAMPGMPANSDRYAS